MDSTPTKQTTDRRGSRRFVERLQGLDRRVIYGVLCVVSVLSFILKPLPVSHVSPETRAVFQAVESCPDDKVIVLDSSWDMGSQSENRPQFRALVQHMFRRNIKFIVTTLGTTPFAPKIAQDQLDELAKEYEAEYGVKKQYGVDYVNLGFKSAGGSTVVGAPLGFLLDAFARDIHAVYPTDINNTPVSEIPLMQKVNQVHLVVCVTYEPALEWISFIRGQFGTPVVFSCMSIVVPLYAIYYESNQLAGILGGTRGAAEYERLLKLKKPGEGTQLMTPQSFAHLLMIAFIIIGNIGYLSVAGRRR
jgi:hypothetical protein